MKTNNRARLLAATTFGTLLTAALYALCDHATFVQLVRHVGLAVLAALVTMLGYATYLFLLTVYEDWLRSKHDHHD